MAIKTEIPGNIKLRVLFFLLYIFISFSPASLLAQHDHKDINRADSSLTQIFFNESSFGKITVFSSSYPLTVNKEINYRLLISMNDTAMKLNITDTKLVVRKIYDKDIHNPDFKAAGDDIGVLNTSFIFAKAGNYKFELKLFVVDSAGAKYLADFEFTQNVMGSADKTNNSHHGFMGMGSEMWIIMGAAMIAMMAVVLMLSSNHR